MIQNTIFLYKVKNPVFGEFDVQTDEQFPSMGSRERVVELYNQHFKDTPYAKEHPEVLEQTECVSDRPQVLAVLFSENKILQMI